MVNGKHNFYTEVQDWHHICTGFMINPLSSTDLITQETMTLWSAQAGSEAYLYNAPAKAACAHLTWQLRQGREKNWYRVTTLSWQGAQNCSSSGRTSDLHRLKMGAVMLQMTMWGVDFRYLWFPPLFWKIWMLPPGFYPAISGFFFSFSVSYLTHTSLP